MQKRHCAYDPELDRLARVDELRAVYKAMMAERGSEKGPGEGVDPDDASFVSSDVATYFANERGVQSRQTLVGTENGGIAVAEKSVRLQQ